MNLPVKKLKNGLAVPVFGLGTWQMGGGHQRDLNNDDAADVKAIKAAIDLGVTHIDTAEIYANGYSETLVGRAIKDYDRTKLFVVSKIDSDMSDDGVLNSCRKSLERLGTHYLDLYLIHSYDPSVELRETMRAMDKLIVQGLVKNIGVSNFSKERLAQAQSYTQNKIVCDQVHYNLKIREVEATGLLDYCQKNDIFLVAYRPLEKGKLLTNVPPILQLMCDKYSKTPAQVAINWLISQPYVLTLAKARAIEHLKENLGAIAWTMDEVDIEKLRHQYPDQKLVSEVLPLG